MYGSKRRWSVIIFKGRDYMNFYKNKNIQIQHIVLLCTPQLTRPTVIQHANRIVMKMATSLLLKLELPVHLWLNTVQIAKSYS